MLSLSLNEPPRLRAVALAVILAHLCLLLWMGTAAPSAAPPPRRKVQVRTVALQEEKRPAVVPPAPVKSKPKPKPRSRPNAKPKAAVKKKSPADARKKRLLAEAKKKLKGLDKGVATAAPATKIKLPEKVGNLSGKEARYRDELASRLELLLRLPEEGAVDVKLTLYRSGEVAKVVVAGALSRINREYVEKTLPGLKLPPFGQSFGSASEETFSITLTSTSSSLF